MWSGERQGRAGKPARPSRRLRTMGYWQELEIIFTERTRMRCSGIALDELDDPDIPDMLPLWPLVLLPD